MTIEDALEQACAEVGIVSPKSYRLGQWSKTDTLSRKNGKGDGRVIVNEKWATAYNWQTGERSTVWLDGQDSYQQRQERAVEIRRTKEKQAKDAARAAGIATELLARATSAAHPYLISKGFKDEKGLVLGARFVSDLGGSYLVPSGGAHALIIPARRDGRITSAQLIWEDGTKKFLFGGEIGGASHRIATGVDTWLCEGYATGLSVRAALRGLKVRGTVLCCFSAMNVATVARLANGRVFIAADNDRPLETFMGLGTGEHYAKQTGLPYGMPPEVKTDFNDMHQSAGIFAVQRVLTSIMARRAA